MKVEAGKYYRTRDGEKAGPMAEWIDEPKKLRDMTNDEIGALVRATPSKRQVWSRTYKDWLDGSIRGSFVEPSCAYRLKPEPEVETDTIYGEERGLPWEIQEEPHGLSTWRVTVTWTDGVPEFGKPERIE